MTKCTAITQGGTRCKGVAIDGSPYCYAHHPDHATARKAAASKGGKRGGRGRPVVEVGAIKALLSDLTDKILEGELETSRAAVANQLLNTHLRAIELERKIKETDELEARLEELEEAARQQRGYYGA